MSVEQAFWGLVTVLLATLLGYVIGMSRGLGRLEGMISEMSKRMEEGFSTLKEEMGVLRGRMERLEEDLKEVLRRPAPAER